MKTTLLLAAAVLALAACPQPTPVPPAPPADAALPLGDAPSPPPAPLDACQLGCAALVAASCPIGDGGADCAGFLRTLDNGKEPNKSTGHPITCAQVAAVKSKTDAQAIGFVCPP